MAAHTNYYYFVISTILLYGNALSPSPPMVAASPDLIAKVCNDKLISNRDFCFEALSDPQAATAKNRNQLCKAAMKSAAKDAQTTLNLIQGMTKKQPSSSGSMKALKTCEEVFKFAVNSFGMIPSELRQDALTANYDVVVIGPEADSCEKALADAKLNAPLISNGNRNLKYYSAIGSVFR